MIETGRILNPKVEVETDGLMYYFHIFTELDEFVNWKHTLDVVTVTYLTEKILGRPREYEPVKGRNNDKFEYFMFVNKAGQLCLEISSELLEDKIIVEWDYDNIKNVLDTMLVVIYGNLKSCVKTMVESIEH